MPIVKPPMKPAAAIPEQPVQAVILSPRIARTAAEMALKASTLTDASLDALERVIENPEAKASDVIAAARELLSRAHGLPAQTVDIRRNEGNTLAEQRRLIIEHDPEGWEKVTTQNSDE